MARNVVNVQIKADARDFEQGFGKAETKAVGLGAAIGTFAGNVAYDLGQRAMSAVTGFVGDSLTAFSDLNESLNALDVQYGEHAEGIKRLGEEAAQNLGLSNAEFNTFAVSLSSFATQIAEDSGDVVGTVDEMTTRVADFASVMNLEVPEAAEKFRSGLAGESEPLRQFGIDVSAATVEAQALKDGIWDGIGAMTESEKVQGRYATIMEQTSKVQGDFANTADQAANKQRILTAEQENQSAELGAALLPLQEVWLDVQSRAIPIIGALATEVGKLTGAITDADSAMAEFGTDAEGMSDVLGDLQEDSVNLLAVFSGVGLFSELVEFVNGPTLDELKSGFEEWLGAAERTPEEMKEIRDELERLESQGKLTTEEFEALTKSVEDQQVADANAARDAGRHRGSREKLTEAIEGGTEATEDANEAQKTQNELLDEALDRINSLIDPAFGYMQAQSDLAEAQERYNEAVKEFGEDSPEAIAAAEDIAEANMGIQSAVIAIGEEGVPAAMEALKAMGVPQSVIDKFAADKERIEEIFRNMVLRIGVSAPTLFPTRPSSGGIGWESRSRAYYARGGIARSRQGGQDAVVAEAGVDEAMTPLTAEGLRPWAQALVAELGMAGGVGGPPIHVHVAGSVVTEYELVTRIHDALLERQRRNGSLGFKR